MLYLAMSLGWFCFHSPTFKLLFSQQILQVAVVCDGVTRYSAPVLPMRSLSVCRCMCHGSTVLVAVFVSQLTLLLSVALVVSCV